MKTTFRHHMVLMAIDHLRNCRARHAQLLRRARRNEENLKPGFWLLMNRRSSRWLADNESRLEDYIANLIPA